jgi:hypothetical protein
MNLSSASQDEVNLIPQAASPPERHALLSAVMVHNASQWFQTSSSSLQPAALAQNARGMTAAVPNRVNCRKPAPVAVTPSVILAAKHLSPPSHLRGNGKGPGGSGCMRLTPLHDAVVLRCCWTQSRFRFRYALRLSLPSKEHPSDPALGRCDRS